MQRIVTAVIGLAIIILSLLVSVLWDLAVCIAFMIVAKEVGMILKKIGLKVSPFFMMLTVPCYILPAVFLPFHTTLAIGTTATLLLYLIAISGLETGFSAQLLLGFVVAAIYPAVLATFLVEMRFQNTSLLIFMMAIVFIGDAAALYTGRYLTKRGKAHKIPRKLGELTSPNKTFEGFGAGLVVAGVIMPIICYKIGLINFSPGKVILIALAFSISGMLGDLFESFLKRKAGVKDSGTILPGHGGMLDRFDALLFAAVIGWILLV